MKTIEKPQAIIYISLFILLAIIVLILTLSGCMSERIEGNRDLQTEDRSTQAFSEVVSQGSFDVIIIPDDNAHIVVKAESNILPYLYTMVSGTTMTVGFKNGYNIHEHYPVEVFLYTPEARSIRLSGSGTVDCKGFSSEYTELQISGSGSISGDFITDNLDGSISGSGNMKISGIAKSSSLKISGSGDINTLDMKQQKCFASISGSGNIKTAVSESLDAHISGSGSIYFLGDPVITTHITGTGKVVKY